MGIGLHAFKFSDNLFRNSFLLLRDPLKMHLPSFDLTHKSRRLLRIVISKWKTKMRNRQKYSGASESQDAQHGEKRIAKGNIRGVPRERITIHSQHGL